MPTSAATWSVKFGLGTTWAAIPISGMATPMPARAITTGKPAARTEPKTTSAAEGHRQAGRPAQLLDGGGGLAGVAARAVGQRERGIGDVTAGGQLDLADAGHAGLVADPGQEPPGGGPMAGDAGEDDSVALARLGRELGGQDVLGGLRVGAGQAAAVGPLPGQARAEGHGGHDQGDPGQEDSGCGAGSRQWRDGRAPESCTSP